VIPEPTGFDSWIANDGVSYFRVTVEGKSAHAAETDAGVNAISKLLPIYHALEDLHDERKTTVHDELFEEWHEHTVSLNLGTLRGGEWVSSVPDEATLEARISHAPEETRESLRETVEGTVERAAEGDPWLEEHPPEIEWFGWRGRSAKIDPDESIVRTVEAVAETALDRESHAKGFPGESTPDSSSTRPGRRPSASGRARTTSTAPTSISRSRNSRNSRSRSR